MTKKKRRRCNTGPGRTVRQALRRALCHRAKHSRGAEPGADEPPESVQPGAAGGLSSEVDGAAPAPEGCGAEEPPDRVQPGAVGELPSGVGGAVPEGCQAGVQQPQVDAECPQTAADRWCALDARTQHAFILEQWQGRCGNSN